MSKASELYNIRKRNISGDQKRSEDGYNLFSTIVAPDSTAFAARLELESELAARLRYCRAFMYELGKVLTAREIAELAETGGLCNGVQISTANRLLSLFPKFCKIKQLYPWSGAAKKKKKLFSALYQNRERRAKQREYRQANRDRLIEYKHRYYAEYKEEILCKQKEYRQANRTRIIAYLRRYYAEHQAELIQKKREYTKTNPERVREAQRKYRQTHKDKIKEWQRVHYLEHKEEIKAKSREYKEANREKVRERRKEYYAKNCERIKARCRENYAKRKKSQSEDKSKCQNQANSGTYCAEP